MNNFAAPRRTANYNEISTVNYPLSNETDLSFWQHLDVLRGVLIRIIAAVFGCGVVMFCLKGPLFRALLWPIQPSFPLWQLMPQAEGSLQIPLINTELTQQFLIHMEVALVVGALITLPFILYELVRFISPALYPHEKKAVWPAVCWGFVMFLLGAALSYFLIFPITFRFLANYQVDAGVANMITLRSYVSTLLILSALMGVMFELPVLCRILARLGLLTSAPMRHYRRHAIVAIVILSAVITPTGDAFTLALVALPICLLYEASILVVRRQEKRRKT